MDTCDIGDDIRRLCVYAATLSVVAVLKIAMKRLLRCRYIPRQSHQNIDEGMHVFEQLVYALKAKKMIEADDITWKECLKSHPSAGTYCSRYIVNSEDISLIFGNDRVTSAGAPNGIGIEMANQLMNLKESQRSVIGLNGIVDDDAVDPFPLQARQPPPPPGIQRTTTNKGSKKRKWKRRETMDDRMFALNATLRDIANAIHDASACVDTNRIMEELIKTPGLSEDQFISAIDYVGADKRRANIFFALSGEMRKKWLLKYILAIIF